MPSATKRPQSSHRRDRRPGQGRHHRPGDGHTLSAPDRGVDQQEHPHHRGDHRRDRGHERRWRRNARHERDDVARARRLPMTVPFDLPIAQARRSKGTVVRGSCPTVAERIVDVAWRATHYEPARSPSPNMRRWTRQRDAHAQAKRAVVVGLCDRRLAVPRGHRGVSQTSAGVPRRSRPAARVWTTGLRSGSASASRWHSPKRRCVCSGVVTSEGGDCSSRSSHQT
jgi:hypothetical protein